MKTAGMLMLTLALLAQSATASQQCFERSGHDYEVAWAAEGGTFFDGWNFEEVDFTGGAVRYVSRDEALNEQLALVNGTHAIIRPGGIEERVGSTPPMKQRRSVKLTSNKTWTYFLTAMRFSHTPYGCGVWPSFWALGAGGDWPNRGELDMIEYWDGDESLVSYHGGSVKNNTCKLDKELLNKEGCPHFSDRNHRNYDCATDYSKGELGCGPNNDNFKALSGKGWSNNPGVIAAEWTKEYIKVFYIPEAELPQDLAPGATPKPDTWDEYVISYYPFGPSGCDLDQESLASAKQLVLNIELCGGAGGIGLSQIAVHLQRRVRLEMPQGGLRQARRLLLQLHDRRGKERYGACRADLLQHFVGEGLAAGRCHRRPAQSTEPTG